MRKANSRWIYALAIFVVASSMHSVRAQEQRTTKVDIRSEMNDEKSSIHIRIEKDDGSIYEKSYSSKEEMENDPELKDLFDGDETRFLMESAEHQEGRFDFSVEDDGGDHKKVLMFKSEDGGLNELQEENNIWLEELKSDGDHRFLFETDDGESYRITRDEYGEYQIDRNGQPVDLDKLKSEGELDIDIEEDGSLTIIRDTGNVRKLEDGNYTIDVDIKKEMDDEGNEKVSVHKIVVVDIKGEDEISDIPGIHLNEGMDLGLEDLSFYPNPSSGLLSVRFKAKQEPTEVKIIDMMGREVFRENLNEFNGTYDKQIDLSENEPGVYILQVIQNNRSHSKKIMLE